LALNAEIAWRSGDTNEAGRWFERLLATPDIAYLPPVALEELKNRARAFFERPGC
jgi:hypothetical protein